MGYARANAPRYSHCPPLRESPLTTGPITSRPGPGVQAATARCAGIAVWINPETSKTAARRYRILPPRSEEHTSEIQSQMRITYAVLCLNKKNKHRTQHDT